MHHRLEDDCVARVHRPSAKSAGPDMLNRWRQTDEHHLYLSAKQIGHRRRRAAIRHMRHVIPVIVLKRAPAIWLIPPVPDDPIAVLPGFALAWVMKQGGRC